MTPGDSGVQFAAAEGSPVRAVHDGTVAFSGPFTGYGNLVIVDHGAQTFSLYGQLGEIQVERGATVERGQTIGRRGGHPGRYPRDLLRDANRRQAGRSTRMVDEATMTSRKRLVIILISAPVIAFTVIGGFLGHAMARTDDTYANLRVFQDVVSLILSNYVEQPNMDKRHARAPCAAWPKGSIPTARSLRLSRCGRSRQASRPARPTSASS